ncbi:hypothetical protein FQZ97_737690 [compost metagenome]
MHAQVGLPHRVAARCAIEQKAEVLAGGAVFPYRQGVHAPIRVKLADGDHVGPDGLRHVHGERLEQRVAAGSGHAAGECEQLGFAALLFGGVDEAGQDAFLAVDLDQFGPHPGVDDLAIGVSHAGVVGAQMAFPLDALHKSLALRRTQPAARLERGFAQEVFFVQSLYRISRLVHLQERAVAQPRDRHLQRAEVERLGEPLFGAAQALDGFVLRGDVGHGGDDQPVLRVVAHLAGDQGLEMAAGGTQTGYTRLIGAALGKQSLQVAGTLFGFGPEEGVHAAEHLFAGVAIAAFERRIHVEDGAAVGRLRQHRARAGAEDAGEPLHAAVALLFGALAQLQLFHLLGQGDVGTLAAVKDQDGHDDQHR